MKKRIISFILVLALAVLALAGCAYRYEKDDMSKYVDFDKTAFLAALLELAIEDGDFGWDEGDKDDPSKGGRWQKVEDAIFTTLVGLADTTEKVTTGTPDKYDTYYYCYYITANVDGVIHVIGDVASTTGTTTNMNAAKAIKLQLGMSTLEGLNLKIAEAVKSYDITDKAYAITSTGTTEKDDIVMVSYKKSYAFTDGTEGAEISVSYETVALTDAKTEVEADMTFLSQIVGMTVGSSTGKDFTKVKETIDGKEATVTYTGVKVHWVVDSAATVKDGALQSEITVTDTTITDDSKKETKYKDIYGKDLILYNQELTYHIFPVYYVDVISSYDAKVILETIIAEKISAGTTTEDEHGHETTTDATFKALAAESGFMNGEKTANALVLELVELYTALAEKEEALKEPEDDFEDAKKDLEAKEAALEKAKKALADAEAALQEAGQEATDQQKNAVTEAKALVESAGEAVKAATEDKTEAEEAYNTAKGEVDTAKTNVNNKIDEILACTKTETVDEQEVTKNMADEIVDEYRQQRYDTLESKYKTEIKNNLAQAFYAAAREAIKFKTDADGNEILPEREVKRIYNILIDNLKYEFYEGVDETSKLTNVKVHGTFDEYIKSKYKKTTEDVSVVYDLIMDEARDSVKEVIILHVLKTACDTDVTPTEEDINSYLNLSYLYEYIYGYSIDEEDAKNAALFTNIMDYFLEEVAEEDYAEDATYGENKVQYKHIKYDFKTDDEEEETEGE